jgi:DNA-directed RNA polymerase beta subunit
MNRIYWGIWHFLELVHDSEPKVQNRFVAGYIAKTHQPVTGADNAGGQRWGEMEVIAPITHGLSATVQENMTRNSDYFIIFTCGRCKTQVYKLKSLRYICPTCRKPADLRYASSTYVQQILKNYLFGSWIKMEYTLE